MCDVRTYISHINACHMLPIRNKVYATHTRCDHHHVIVHVVVAAVFFKFSNSWLFLYKFHSMPLFYRSIEAHNFHGHLALNIALHLRIYSTRCCFFFSSVYSFCSVCFFLAFCYFQCVYVCLRFIFFCSYTAKKLSDFNLDVFFFAPMYSIHWTFNNNKKNSN